MWERLYAAIPPRLRLDPAAIPSDAREPRGIKPLPPHILARDPKNTAHPFLCPPFPQHGVSSRIPWQFHFPR